MIETDRLLLRPFRADDYAVYVTLAGMRQPGSFLPAHSKEECWHRLLRYIGHWTALGWGMFAIFERAGGAFLGEAGLADFHRGFGPDFDGYPEAAWNLLPAAQGQGMALEAADAVHAWFARSFASRRCVCMIDPANTPSLRLAERLGYRAFAEREYKDAVVHLFARDAGSAA